MKNLYTHDELINIIYWWENNLTPQEIFGFDPINNQALIKSSILEGSINYNESLINTKAKKLLFKCHPDKCGNKDKIYQEFASEVFLLITQAKEYLLFSIGINDISSEHNVFAAYYYKETLPEDILVKKLKNILNKIRKLKESNLDASEELFNLQQLSALRPQVISSYAKSNPELFYLLSLWNCSEVMDILLKEIPIRKNIMTNSSPRLSSPFEIAVYHGHIETLKVFQKYFSDSWLKSELYPLTNHNEIISMFTFSKNVDDQLITKNLKNVLECYVKLFPGDERPLLLPFAADEFDVDKLNNAIKGCSLLYTLLDDNLLHDPFMIIAFLAQKPDQKWLHSIPKSIFKTSFGIALQDYWPELNKVSESPVSFTNGNYQNFIISSLALLPSVILLGLMVAYPGIVPSSLALSLICISSMSILLCITNITNYLINIYPESNKINAILKNNNFFNDSINIQPVDHNKLGFEENRRP